uniref:transglutaminase domain-containing protein n=1 Tax=uncultured Draconibacterium sp. TaxID=1573823 RepID=UPI003216B412
MKNCLLLLCAALMYSFAAFSHSGQVKKSFKTPGTFPTGLCFDGKNLWLSDRGSDKIYCLNPDNGKVISEIESPAYWPMGLTWDGEYLWNADFRGRTNKSEDRDGMIFKIDPKDGTILKTLRAPSSSPMGLTWDGRYLWCVDDSKDKVIQFSPEDGATIRSFPSPAKDPKGMTFDGKYLWISDRIQNEIYMVDPSTGYVIVILDAPGPHSFGLAVHDNKLWNVDHEDNTIYEMTIRDGVKYIRKNKKTHKVVFTHNVECFGPGKIKTLDVYLGVPENRPNQDIDNITYNKKPADFITDKWDLTTAHFSYKDIKPGERATSEMTTTFNSYDVRYFLYPEQVGTLSEIPQQIKDQYLGDNDKYQINHEIVQNTVKKVVGDEQNPYWIVRKLHQYLIGHLHYLMDGAWDMAPTVLSQGHGSCSEYTFVFISLCKAAGLPARYVGSTWIKKDEASMDDVYHRWVEVYLPNFGWVPTDPTHGDRTSPRDQAFPIGLVRNEALITTQSGGGSETMEWTYNSNERYTTEPKTNLNITHYGDWLPVNIDAQSLKAKKDEIYMPVNECE